MEKTNIFSEKFQSLFETNYHSVLFESYDREETSDIIESWSSSNEKNMSCSYCRIQFSDPQVQRDHYKLDWHRYNLKQSLLSKPPISEEEFYEKNGNDDLSSISGSDSEREDTFVAAKDKYFLQDENNKVYSIYKCILLDKKEEVPEERVIRDRLRCCHLNTKWTIVMVAGGHFSAAIFQDNEILRHKSFHYYTVRAGQGGSQSTRDGKQGGSQPKSAGASLRRHNEQSLAQNIKDTLLLWKVEIEASSRIFYRATGSNRAYLFGSSPLLDRLNNCLRTIPFSTRRPTFTEVKRVYSLLSTSEVYVSMEKCLETFAIQKPSEVDTKRNKNRSSSINRAKSREVIDRPLPVILSSASSSELELDKRLEDLELSTNDLEISFNDLKEFEDSLTSEQRKKQPKKKKPKKSKAKKLREQEDAKRKEIIDILSQGDLEKLKKLVEENSAISEDHDKNTVEEFVNKIVDENQNTLLHIAALNEQDELVKFLLGKNANPCMKNKTQHTAYTCSQSKQIRETLKTFAKENPDKFNYNKAQIPVNSLTNEELADKKKLLRKIKREKEKEKKIVNDIKKKEEIEKDRFLQLSDREKMALAAERRILNSKGTVTTRCFTCALDIAGKVPFEYSSNLFCSVECLKAHRMLHSTIR
ncbi:unnamed protein product [Phaedon cochleariae]|uniref:VLRF1 domain-containing protein n=1 Tax=Phaedon cochleariae TaxID=80249 RepID=A0A9P0DXU9_PHACE|nr:unnamed protein product [Phaedon cochleariae]